MGMVYYNLGENINALNNYKKALNIREKVLGLDNVDTAASYSNIGIIYMDINKKKYVAENYLEKAMNIYRKFLGRDNEETIEATKNYESAKDMK